MARDLRIRQHTLRTSFIFYDDRKPYFYLTLTGPNGSPAGSGPKRFPLIRRAEVRVPCPQWHFRYSFRLRQLGRWVYKLSNANWRFYRWLQATI